MNFIHSILKTQSDKEKVKCDWFSEMLREKSDVSNAEKHLNQMLKIKKFSS